MQQFLQKLLRNYTGRRNAGNVRNGTLIMSFDGKGIGPALAISGSTLSIIGALLNNLWLDHTGAMKLWMISNILLLAWAYGYDRGLWDGGLSGKALVVMYLVFTITNFYGLFILGAK